jgi:hypothetical protein
VRSTSVAEVRRLRTELLERGVLSVTAEGILYSRRMVRTAAKSAIGREHGSRGGNPALKPKPLTVATPSPLTPKDKTHVICHLSSERSSGFVDEKIDARASAFLERYPEVYARVRSGAAYRVSRINQERDLEYARELVRGWPNAERLEDMLEIFLRMKIGDKNCPGTPGQFLHMAPECDRALKENGR